MNHVTAGWRGWKSPWPSMSRALIGRHKSQGKFIPPLPFTREPWTLCLPFDFSAGFVYNGIRQWFRDLCRRIFDCTKYQRDWEIKRVSALTASASVCEYFCVNFFKLHFQTLGQIPSTKWVIEMDGDDNDNSARTQQGQGNVAGYNEVLFSQWLINFLIITRPNFHEITVG